MTKDDLEWLINYLKEISESDGFYKSCSECDIFEKCQKENRDYCEKEQNDEDAG